MGSGCRCGRERATPARASLMFLQVFILLHWNASRPYGLFEVDRLRRRWCRFADLKILNAYSCIDQLRYPMRSLASSGPCLVRLSGIAKLWQNRGVSTARRFFHGVRRNISTQPAQPILKL